jgi:hypothetical protein
MKKILIILVSLIVVLGIFFSVIYSFRVPLINRNLSKLFSVPVRLETFDLSLKQISIGNFEIYNPPKSVVPKAMTIRSLEVDAPLWNYLEPHTEIDNIVINGINVDVEFYDPLYRNMNWDPILGSSSSSTKEAQKGEDSSASVKSLTIQNLQITLRLPNQQPQVFTVRGPVVYKNLDSRKGGVTKVVADLVVRIVLQQVFSVQNLKRFANELFEGPVTPIENLIPVPLP